MQQFFYLSLVRFGTCALYARVHFDWSIAFPVSRKFFHLMLMATKKMKKKFSEIKFISFVQQWTINDPRSTRKASANANKTLVRESVNTLIIRYLINEVIMPKNVLNSHHEDTSFHCFHFNVPKSNERR